MNSLASALICEARDVEVLKDLKFSTRVTIVDFPSLKNFGWAGGIPNIKPSPHTSSQTRK